MTQNYEPQLVTGPGSLQELPLLLQGQKVLLVHGHRPVEDGLLQKVRVLLEQHGIARENMGQILPDPTFKSVKRGIRLCRKTGCTMVLSLGGGSTLQCARGIALGVPYKGKIKDFWNGKKKPKKALAVAAVLTDPATGDELSDSCTLVKKGKQKKFRSPMLTCRFAILDPEQSQYPPYPTMNQGFVLVARLFACALEARDRQLPACREIMDGLLESIQGLETDIHNMEARTGLYKAGVQVHRLPVSDKSGLTTLAGDLAFACSLPLGTALSALFPAWWDVMMQKKPAQMQRISHILLGCGAQRGRQRMLSLISEMNLAASLPEAGLKLTARDIKGLTEDSMLRTVLQKAARD